MSESMVMGPAVVAGLSAALDELLELDLARCSAGELMGLLEGFERVRRRMPVLDHRLIAEVDSRGVAQGYGCRSVVELLRLGLRLHPGEAKARVEASADLGPRRAVTGEFLEPVFAATAAAQAAGVVSVGHAEVIVSTVHRLPVAVAAVHAVQVQDQLVEAAAQVDPVALQRVARRIVDTLDPDGTAPRDEDHQRRRGVTFTTHRDGSGTMHNHLTPEALALAKTAIEALARPAPAPGAGTDGDAHSSTLLGADPRTAEQRRHDALAEIFRQVLADGGLPATGGTPVTLVITMTQAQFQSRRGTAWTGYGDPISVPETLRMADEADIVTVVFDAHSGITSYGRERRVATPSQRLALAARDGGCSFYGCTQPPHRCQAHHVHPWHDGGLTDLNNLALLCSFHHHHFQRLGYTCTMITNTPHWTAPPWLDPHQTPRRNPIR